MKNGAHNRNMFKKIFESNNLNILELTWSIFILSRCQGLQSIFIFVTQI